MNWRSTISVSFTLMFGYALGVWIEDWWAIVGIPVGVAIIDAWPLIRRRVSNQDKRHERDR